MNCTIRDIGHGLIQDSRLSMYPSLLIGHREGETHLKEDSDHVFGVVMRGQVELTSAASGVHTLSAGMYFSAPGAASIRGLGDVSLFVRKGFRGLFQIGGPVEPFGRLCYIDNCRTTVLVPPPRKGDPCLNLLTFPPGIKQTPHIHPTIRFGAVMAGTGSCVLAGGARTELKPGAVFFLDEGLIHCFHSEESLSIIAYHPDSDVGLTDQEHPMLSRTYVTSKDFSR